MIRITIFICVLMLFNINGATAQDNNNAKERWPIGGMGGIGRTNKPAPKKEEPIYINVNTLAEDEIKALIEQLNDDDWHKRESATKKLMESYSPEALKLVNEHIKDKRPEVADRAVIIMAVYAANPQVKREIILTDKRFAQLKKEWPSILAAFSGNNEVTVQDEKNNKQAPPQQNVRVVYRTAVILTADNILTDLLTFADNLKIRQDNLYKAGAGKADRKMNNNFTCIAYPFNRGTFMERFLAADFESGKLNGQTFENLVRILMLEKESFGGYIDFWPYYSEHDSRVLYDIFKELCTVPGDSPLGKDVKNLDDAFKLIRTRTYFNAVRANWYDLLAHGTFKASQVRKFSATSRPQREPEPSAFEYQIDAYRALKAIESSIITRAFDTSQKLGKLDKMPDLAGAKDRFEIIEPVDKEIVPLLKKLKEKYPQHALIIDIFSGFRPGPLQYFIDDDFITLDEWISLLTLVLLPDENAK